MSHQLTKEREFSVPVSALYQTVTDFDHYKDFLSEVSGSQVVSGKGSDKVRVRFEINLMKRFSYDLEFHLIPEKEVRWKLLESDFFKVNEGRWIFSPQDSITHVKYELSVQFGFLVPGWITKKLTENNLPQMFDKFESKARELNK